jgi:hypothetical protein
LVVAQPATGPRRRSVWDLAILVLGVNIFVSFLLLPALHLERPGPSKTTLLLLALAPIALGLGVALRHAVLLLAVFPLALVVPAAVNPQLVGVNIYTRPTFVLVALSFLAYLIGTLFLLHQIAMPAPPELRHELREYYFDARWRRRLRMYRWLAGLAALFPTVLIATLFLHPGVQADLERAYPGRANEASAFFGVLGLALWLGLFYADFLTPLRAHVRGDAQLRLELEQVRRRARRRRPGPGFYVAVAAALGLMLALLIARG